MRRIATSRGPSRRAGVRGARAGPGAVASCFDVGAAPARCQQGVAKRYVRDPRSRLRERVDFSKIRTAIPIPNLIEVQKRSYERFLQMNTAPADRDDQVGLQAVFKSIFPIKDFRETCSLEFVEYTIGNWECKCGELQGIEHLRSECEFCGHRLMAPERPRRRGRLPRLRQPDPGQGPRVRPVRRAGRAASSSTTSRSARSAGRPTPCRSRSRSSSWSTTRTRTPRPRASATSRSRRSTSARSRCSPTTGPSSSTAPSASSSASCTAARASSSRPTRPERRFMAKVIPYRGSWVEFETDAQERPLRAHRPQAQVPGDGLPARPGLRGRRGDPAARSTRPVEHARGRRQVRVQGRRRGWSAARPRTPVTRPVERRGAASRRAAGSAPSSVERAARGRHRVGPGRPAEARRRVHASATSSTRRPARCCSRRRSPLTEEALDRARRPAAIDDVRGRLPGARGGRRHAASRRWPRTRSRPSRRR